MKSDLNFFFFSCCCCWGGFIYFIYLFHSFHSVVLLLFRGRKKKKRTWKFLVDFIPWPFFSYVQNPKSIDVNDFESITLTDRFKSRPELLEWWIAFCAGGMFPPHDPPSLPLFFPFLNFFSHLKYSLRYYTCRLHTLYILCRIYFFSRTFSPTVFLLPCEKMKTCVGEILRWFRELHHLFVPVRHHRNDDPRDEGERRGGDCVRFFFFFARLNNSSSEVVQPRRSGRRRSGPPSPPPLLSLNVLIKHDSIYIYISIGCVCVSTIPYSYISISFHIRAPAGVIFCGVMSAAKRSITRIIAPCCPCVWNSYFSLDSNRRVKAQLNKPWEMAMDKCSAMQVEGSTYIDAQMDDHYYVIIPHPFFFFLLLFSL